MVPNSFLLLFNKVLPCDSSPCLNGGKCDNRGTTFKCRCDFGFEGIRCEHKSKYIDLELRAIIYKSQAKSS